MHQIELGAGVPRRRRWLFKPLARLVLWLAGWQIDVRLPALPKAVLIGAPHTSNWDFVFGISAVFLSELDIRFYAKHQLFRGPLGWLLRWFGGRPVDRGAAASVVEQTQEFFAQSDSLYMTLAPEGTRARVDKWKSGFWRMAVAAQVPIVCGYIDYQEKKVGIGPIITPSNNYEADLEKILDYYASISAAHPENFGGRPSSSSANSKTGHQ